MFAYPGMWPTEEVAYLLPLLRGQVPSDHKAAIQAAWVVIGYGLDKTIPPAPVSSLYRVEVADQLAGLHVKMGKMGAVFENRSFPWQQTLNVLLTLIQLWLAQQPAPVAEVLAEPSPG